MLTSYDCPVEGTFKEAAVATLWPKSEPFVDNNKMLPIEALGVFNQKVPARLIKSLRKSKTTENENRY